MSKKSKSHLDQSRTTPVGMMRYAIDFHAAALAVDDALGSQPGYEIIAPAPAYYLLGHALELALKAYLLEKGKSLVHVKHTLRHDLGRCLAEAEDAGLSTMVALSDADRELIRVLNALYSDKQFEYIETGAKTFPMFGSLQVVIRRVLIGVVDAIPEAHRCLDSQAGRMLGQ